MAKNTLLILLVLVAGAQLIISGPDFEGWVGVPDHGFVRHNQLNNNMKMYVACTRRTGPWFFPNGTEVPLHRETSGFWSAIYKDRISLYRKEDAPSGICYCQDSNTTLYVGLYDTSKGEPPHANELAC